MTEDERLSDDIARQHKREATWADRKTWTPGPWVADGGSILADASPTGSIVCRQGGGVDWFEYDPEQSEANARLIAAAPELYEALRRYSEIGREVHDHLNHGVPNECCGFAMNLAEARSALAKAVGE